MIAEANYNRASIGELRDLLGRGRAKRGMFEGDLIEGELEIGQVSALLNDVKPASDIVNEIWNELNDLLQNPLKL